MSKALIIKGANFSTNKVETITLSSVPCTALELSQSTITFTAMNSVTLTATKTPSNTTDALTWASSDETVATVADGVVTCVGLGTATITATCGEQTATCSVSAASISIDASTLLMVNGYMFSSTDLTVTPQKDYAGLYTYAKGRVYASSAETASGNKAFSTDYESLVGAYPIPLPKNVATIEVQAANTFTVSGQIYMFDSTQTQTYLTGTYTNMPTALVKQFTEQVRPSSGKYTFTVTAEGADSFAVRIGGNDVSTLSEEVTITFKPAS